jgi:hypothetical protein
MSSGRDLREYYRGGRALEAGIVSLDADAFDRYYGVIGLPA